MSVRTQRPYDHATTRRNVIVRFVVGLAAGAAIGVAGAVYYSIRTGRDLRDVAGEFVGQVRAELENRDLDSLASRIEARVGQVQAQVEGSRRRAKPPTRPVTQPKTPWPMLRPRPTMLPRPPAMP